MASRRRPFMSSFKKPPSTSFEDLTPVANSDSQNHSANPFNQGSSFASIGNLQSMNSIEDSLPGFFDLVFVLLFPFLLPSHQTQISIDFHRFVYLCSSCFTILLRSEIADLTLVGISDSQHHSENRSNRGSSSASIGDLQSLNSIDNSLPESFDQIHDQEEWEKYRKWATTCVAIYASYVVSLVSILHCRDHIRKSISEQGDYERYALIKRLTTLEDADCRSQLRMSKDAFATLVSMLKRTQFLRDNPQSKVEEQVAKFLHIIGHNLRNRTIKFFYRRSSETVSRHFHQVLKAIISLEDIFLKQPDGFNCPPEIRNNPKYLPYFKVEGDQECSVEIDKKHLKWNNQMNVVLIDSLLDQMLKGQKIGGSFTSSAYRAASNAVSTKFSVHCDSSHVRNRLKTLKRNLAMAKDMLTTDSGFGYNHSTQLIEATAGVWAAYLKAKPKASQFRHAPIQNFQKLCQLFEKDRATGSLAIGPKEKRLRWAGQQILLDEENTDHTESLSENFDGIGTQDDQTAEVSCSSNSKKRKNKSGDTLSEEIRSIKEGLDAVAIALDRGNLRNYTNGQLFEEIEKVSGMSDTSRMKVYQVLAKEVSDARAYLECPIERRGLWLSVKFGSSIFDA
ncbi:hypothetical protein ACSBR2_039934 [Camellia fascicularis]